MSSYRNYIALALGAVISLNVLALPLSYLSFRLNQNYYATVLCENPEKPITVCGGICYLKKQLPSSDQASPVTLASKIDIPVYFQWVDEWKPLVSSPITTVYASYLVLFSSAYLASPYHPPQG